MTDKENPFENLPDFKETIARLARVPSEASEKEQLEFCYRVRDEKPNHLQIS